MEDFNLNTGANDENNKDNRADMTDIPSNENAVENTAENDTENPNETVENTVDTKNKKDETVEKTPEKTEEKSVEKQRPKFFGGKNGTFKSVIKGVAVALTLIAFFYAGYFSFYLTYGKEFRSMLFVYKTYKDHYFFEDDDKHPAKVLTEGLMDIYSEFYTAEEYQKELSAGKGEQKGFGIAFSKFNINRVAGNSPAEKSGLKKGGVIVGYKTTESDFVSAEDFDAFYDYLSALSDSVTLTLKVDYSGVTSEYSMKKAAYRENYVFYSDNTGAYRFTDDSGKMAMEKYSDDGEVTLSAEWGYLRYTAFNGDADGLNGSVGQFAAALDKAIAGERTKLIIDLRNNGGGFMSILCKLSGMLCNRKTDDGATFNRTSAQIVKYKNGNRAYFNIDTSVAKNADGKFYCDIFDKIVVLANENSASASEAFIGALLDYDEKGGGNGVRVIVDPSVDKNSGKTVYKTYGKGIMQSTFKNDLTGEALKLTTAQIYWPLSETCIHGIGITPDTDSRVFKSDGDPIALAMTL